MYCSSLQIYQIYIHGILSNVLQCSRFLNTFKIFYGHFTQSERNRKRCMKCKSYKKNIVAAHSSLVYNHVSCAMISAIRSSLRHRLKKRTGIPLFLSLPEFCTPAVYFSIFLSAWSRSEALVKLPEQLEKKHIKTLDTETQSNNLLSRQTK